MNRLVVSTAEASGDHLLAELIVALRVEHNQLPVVGSVGPLALAAGATVLPGITAVPPAMGLVEVLRSIPAHRRNRRALLEALRPGDTLLTVDSPDLHLGLAREARRRGIRTVGYVSPQLWAWRPGRAPAVAKAFDQLLCLFSFEPAMYASTGLDARWVGHPAVDRVGRSTREPGALALFPGSRPAELRRHLEVFLTAARRSAASTVLLAAAPGIDPSALTALPGFVALGPRITVVPGPEAIRRAERALAKSGTVTLELAMAGVPTVVAHRVSPLTYWLGRTLVRGVTHLALPNVLLNRAAVPEFVQHFDVDTLLGALKTVEAPPTLELARLLGEPGAARRAARALLGGAAG
ncbi:MAG: hypothetical protein EXR69_05750 [Myxococcales bacterium]|nr:hypothetical protein [Myxococcales bacterium]